MQKGHGFTLIECLVALLIIAIVLASTTRAIGLSVEDVHDSYIREAANWVADNQFNQYHLDNNFPTLGTSKQSVTMAGINFNVNSTVSNTPNPYFRRVEITVSEQKTPDYIIYKTVSFISQY